MLTPYEEILQILADIETEKDLPRGLLRQIYDKEAAFVHLRSRTDIHDDLQSMISDAAGKAS